MSQNFKTLINPINPSMTNKPGTYLNLFVLMMYERFIKKVSHAWSRTIKSEACTSKLCFRIILYCLIYWILTALSILLFGNASPNIYILQNSIDHFSYAYIHQMLIKLAYPKHPRSWIFLFWQSLQIHKYRAASFNEATAN